jgi:cell shape-determining protein MreC
VAASRPTNNRFVLLVLVLLAVTLVTLSARSGGQGIFNKVRGYARDVAHPFQSAAHAALEPVGNFLYGAFNYRSMEQENQLLRRELAAAQTAQAQADSEQAQAQQVLAQAHLDYLGAVPTVAAQVVGLGSANFEQTVEINRGSVNGVAVGEPVVSAGGLVGSVSAVTAHLSTVTLLDDPGFTVGVEVVPRPGAASTVGSSTSGSSSHGATSTTTSAGNSATTTSTTTSAGNSATTTSSTSAPTTTTTSTTTASTTTAGETGAAGGGGKVVVGAATGQGAGHLLSVQDVNVGSNIKRGDQLVTSGLQLEHFPEGIPVGTVASVYSPPGDLQLAISMKPYVDLGSLQVVQVLLWSAQSG